MRKSGITLSAGKYTIKLSVRKLIRIVWFTAGAIFMGWLVLS